MWVIRKLVQRPQEAPKWEYTRWHRFYEVREGVSKPAYDINSIEDAYRFVDQTLNTLFPADTFMIEWREDATADLK